MKADSNRPVTTVRATGDGVDVALSWSPVRSRNLWDSLRCAFAGLGHAWRTQRNLRVHLVAALAVAGLGLYLRVSALELALLVVVAAAVVVAELVNTALEAVVDLASPELHPLACVVKDVAAAAVLLAAFAAILVGVLVLGPHLLLVLSAAQ